MTLLPKPFNDPRWIDANFMLPSGSNLPAECRMKDGSVETRRILEGSWVHVVEWRTVEKKEK